jgi:hypothetical protein
MPHEAAAQAFARQGMPQVAADTQEIEAKP